MARHFILVKYENNPTIVNQDIETQAFAEAEALLNTDGGTLLNTDGSTLLNTGTE